MIQARERVQAELAMKSAQLEKEKKEKEEKEQAEKLVQGQGEPGSSGLSILEKAYNPSGGPGVVPSFTASGEAMKVSKKSRKRAIKALVPSSQRMLTRQARAMGAVS